MNMKHLFRTLALACGGVLAAAALGQPADYIVAVVNAVPITNAEVRTAMARFTAQLRQQGQPVPATEILRGKVLERLINDRAQLQWAQESGIRVDEAAVDQAEQALARQSQVDVPTFRQRMASEGMGPAALRSQLREQLTLTRLQEREVDARVRISDQEVDRYLQEQLAKNTDPFIQQINLAQLLVAVPEGASPAQLASLQARADTARARLRAGEPFDTLVKELSDADQKNGGQLGLRRADRYPPSFVLATQGLQVGEVSEIVRSGAGFHLLRLVERQAPTALTQTVVQSHARHILLRTGPDLSQAAAVARLAEYRQLIQAGKDDFQALARRYSQDGSAEQGGDLGWASPGMFVPEFEEAMNALADNEISKPLVSRFGVHLIQLIDRRRVELSAREVREAARAQLREAKVEEAFTAWARDIRDRAFVELREPPP